MPIQPRDFEVIRRLVESDSGILLPTDKSYLVEMRLERLARDEGRSLEEILDGLHAGWAAMQSRVVDAMTTNETFFFRDVFPFQVLTHEVLPALIRARQDRRRLRIWSAACSTGQEPYSLVIAIRESCPELLGWELEVLATDLSQRALERAREGWYTAVEVHRGLTQKQVEQYFHPDGRGFRIEPSLRQAVEFRQMNLVQKLPPLEPFDIVFIRNVLIYFDIDTKRRVVSEVESVLRPDGALFLGNGESLQGFDTTIERRGLGKAGYFQRSGPTPPPGGRKTIPL
ncbi:MAG: protein-glutamate O-methyltransferase CheR [Planctomycetota bacterium]